LLALAAVFACSGRAAGQYQSNNFSFTTPQGANIDMLLSQELNRKALQDSVRPGVARGRPTAQGRPSAAAGSLPLTVSDVEPRALGFLTMPFVAKLDVPESGQAAWVEQLDQTVAQLEAHPTMRAFNLAYAFAGMITVALEVQTGQQSSAVQRAQIARVLNDATATWLASESMENKQTLYQNAMLTQAFMIVLSRQPDMDPQIVKRVAADVLRSFGLQPQR
jgi:hypothetical protein